MKTNTSKECNYRSLKSYLTILILFLCQLSAFSANDFTFTYDASGNRILRTCVAERNAKITDQNKGNGSVIDSTLTNNVITIYPNPTAGHLAIDIKNLKETQKVSLLVLDVKGQVLMNKSGLSAVTDLDISSYPSSTYVVRIMIDKKATEWKIIKK